MCLHAVTHLLTRVGRHTTYCDTAAAVYCVHIQKHRLTQTLSLVPRRARVRAEGEHRFPLACTHAQVPTARSGAETGKGGTPAIPTLIRSDEKIDIQRRQPQQDQCSTRYIGCIAVYIHRSPRRLPAVARVLVVHSSTRTDTYPVSKNMYLVYYWRYLCICCVHTPLACRCSPAIARPPPDLLAVRSSSNVPGTTYCCCNVLLLL